ncbi:MAG TPA: dihydropteroate synthase [Stellaceae bacterium]|nr:dihydropteroate synthase [Stellaceae bacterium]
MASGASLNDIDQSPTLRWGFGALARLAEADPASVYLRPSGRLTRSAARGAVAGEAALALSDGTAALTVEVLIRRSGGGADRLSVGAADFRTWLSRHAPSDIGRRLTLLSERLSTPRPPWAGFPADRTLVMGIVNVTPDSFSDGGDHDRPDAAIAHARALRAAGADILDIGGESTRPGSAPVDPAEELARVLPVIRALVAEGAVVSIDTRRALVMAAAIEAGAAIINDVTALAGDPDSLAVVGDSSAAVVLMHMRGEPRTMQQAPHYDAAPLDVFDMLETRIAATESVGVPRDRIAVDPGIGFGKTVEHNLEILRDLSLYQATGCGVLLGVSRKGFIGRLGEAADPKDRLGGSLAVGLMGLDQGASILRVHDVAETAQALRLRRAIEDGVPTETP